MQLGLPQVVRTYARTCRRYWVELGLLSAFTLAVVLVSVFIVGYDMEMAGRGHLNIKTLSLVGGNSQAYADKLTLNKA